MTAVQGSHIPFAPTLENAQLTTQSPSTPTDPLGKLRMDGSPVKLFQQSEDTLGAAGKKGLLTVKFSPLASAIKHTGLADASAKTSKAAEVLNPEAPKIAKPLVVNETRYLFDTAPVSAMLENSHYLSLNGKKVIDLLGRAQIASACKSFTVSLPGLCCEVIEESFTGKITTYYINPHTGVKYLYQPKELSEEEIADKIKKATPILARDGFQRHFTASNAFGLVIFGVKNGYELYFASPDQDQLGNATPLKKEPSTRCGLNTETSTYYAKTDHVTLFAHTNKDNKFFIHGHPAKEIVLQARSTPLPMSVNAAPPSKRAKPGAHTDTPRPRKGDRPVTG
ncbi:MAG: hypothetical protein WCF65_01425 [Parachlamydiaceae bacterium]